MRNIRVATIGCGYFSQYHHHAWQRLGVDLAGICDTDLSRAKSFTRRYDGTTAYDDCREMLEQCQPDIVDIILPPALHLDYIKIACEYSKTVICQKPFTNNIEQARQAVSIAAKTGCNLIVHENFRFQPWYRKIRQLICGHKFGQIYQLRFDLRPGDGQGDDAYLDRQPYFQQMKKFLIRETGIHFIDVFRFLAGEVHSVWADLRHLNPAILGEDAGMFVLEFDNQVRGIFDGNRLSDHVAENQRLTMGELCIEGETGTLLLTGTGNLFFREKGNNQATEINYDWENTGFGGDCVYALQGHVLDHLQHGSGLENQAAEYVTNLEIQELIYRSNQQGKRILL
jgi:predicted dehydrogenase